MPATVAARYGLPEITFASVTPACQPSGWAVRFSRVEGEDILLSEAEARALENDLKAVGDSELLRRLQACLASLERMKKHLRAQSADSSGA